MSSDYMKGFSIIVPTYDRAELLRKALSSIQQLRIPDGWSVEVLVIDNNSVDHTSKVVADAARAGGARLRHIIEKRQGLNHGRNRGLAEAQFEHLLYLDDDMTIEPEWLEGYVEARDAFQADAVVGPVEPVFEEVSADWMTSRMIESVSSFYSQKGDDLLVVSRDRAHELPGCNFAVLRQVALDAGGFHPCLDRSGRDMLAGGDWEFGERLVRRNRRVVYSPKCRIKHLVSQRKLSKEGLRARWEGNGATARVLEVLRGDEKAFGERLHLTLRMVRLFGRSMRCRMLGDEKTSFRWELEARRLKGYLFHSPKIEHSGQQAATDRDRPNMAELYARPKNPTTER